MTRRKAVEPAAAEDADLDGFRTRVREIAAVVLIGFGLYVLLALVTFTLPDPGSEVLPRGDGRNLGGSFGYALASGFTLAFGRAALIPFLFLIAYGVAMFCGRRMERTVLKVLGVVVFTAMVAILLAGPDGLAGAGERAPHGAGGRLGAVLSPRLHRAFGGPGRIMVLLFGALVAFVLATEWLVSTLLQRVFGGVGKAAALAGRRVTRPVLATSGGGLAAVEVEEPPTPRRRRATAARTVVEERPAPAAVEEAEVEEVEEVEEAEEPEEFELEVETDADPEPKKRRSASRRRPPPPPRARRRRSLGVQPTLPFDAVYPFPPVDLFRAAEVEDDPERGAEIERNCSAIENKLAAFRIGARVVHVATGPAVTQYEIRLDEGIKVSRVVSFEADLAAALKAVSVRVVAPIPGKDTVGVEVPNEQRQMVLMRELLETDRERRDMAIPLYLGKDVAGDPIVEDLASMPHLLIAGTTGSGKSVCINCILLSVLMTRTPKQVRLILIDPKMVELQAYKAVPHLACDVVSNMKKAPGVLQWAVDEMERRYALLSAVGVNHIASFNKLGPEEVGRRLQREVGPDDAQLPYMVLVIDELADLMAVAQSEVEESIQRLAQKSRAVGLHVILATQRPSTDVITGVIKANLPCQVAFKVNRKIDSRVILDANGAEKLLGFGDMLYVPPGARQMVRAQGAYVSDAEIGRVVGFLEEKGPKPSFIPDLVQTKTGQRRRPQDRDELYERAVEVILGQQRGSATLLQRALAVGYTRATRLLEMMEEDGLVGPHQGSKSREVYMTLDEWREREAAIAAELAAAEDDLGLGYADDDYDGTEVADGAADDGEAESTADDEDDAEDEDGSEDERG